MRSRQRIHLRSLRSPLFCLAWLWPQPRFPHGALREWTRRRLCGTNDGAATRQHNRATDTIVRCLRAQMLTRITAHGTGAGQLRRRGRPERAGHSFGRASDNSGRCYSSQISAGYLPTRRASLSTPDGSCTSPSWASVYGVNWNRRSADGPEIRGSRKLAGPFWAHKRRSQDRVTRFRCAPDDRISWLRL